MLVVTLDHFKRAIADIAAHGDNDTLPFDIDNRFISDCKEELAGIGFRYFTEISNSGKKFAKNAINSLAIFSERLLVPAGVSGFRITTKIHPFWNIYFNALGVAIAEKLEPSRSERTHSYRYISVGEFLFDRNASWRAFREASIVDCERQLASAVVVQTDISSFYEHVYHHRIENLIDDLFGEGSTLSAQIDRFLNKFSSGRSFGLPVGGQCARILAELLMTSIDRRLAEAKIIWRRYVDDFVLIMPSQAEAYRGLAILSHALADYGLALNRTKTVILNSSHYIDYARAQLSGAPEADKLSEIDLRFDPYSDNPEAEYEQLKSVVESLDIRALLNTEIRKAQPDTFLVTQIGRTLKLHSPQDALQLCMTLLSPGNLHAFRASWSTVMRGVAAVCADARFSDIFRTLDAILDGIPVHSAHLLQAEVSCLHYLRTIRFRRTQKRAEYVFQVYSTASSQIVRRACLDCWRSWKDRTSFVRERNRWDTLKSEEQRMLWTAAAEFGDEGVKFRSQVRQSLANSWRLGIERNNAPTFASLYSEWSNSGH